MTTPFPFTAGAILSASDLNALGTWDSTTWQVAVEGITVGDGTETKLFTRIGDGTDVGFIAYYYELLWGVVTSITGTVYLRFPVIATGARQGSNSSVCFFEDGSGADYFGALYRSNTTRGIIRVFESSGTYVDAVSIAGGVPFTWASGDRIVVSGYYRPGV